MEIIVFLSIVIAVLAVLTSIVLVRRVKKQITEMTDVLVDVKNGNGNRRILSATNELTAPLAYEINEIVVSYESRLSTVRQTEETNRQLMTSLSHDVKTPLASLVGYLEAVESKMVTGAEQEEYIRVATEKAYHLKDFVTALFEWVKLDAGEQIFHFELCDLNEVSRNIMADWVPLLESHSLAYEIEIPETEYMTRFDPTAYTRILNNLLQNVLTHSAASQLSINVAETEQRAKIMVSDNGKGISASDFPISLNGCINVTSPDLPEGTGWASPLQRNW